MAPNLKNIALLVDSAASVDLQALYPVARNNKASTHKRARPQHETASVATENYWDWPADAPVEHKDDSSKAENDAYWAESTAPITESQVDHLTQEEHADYWMEASHDHTTSDDYWNASIPQHKPVQRSESDYYWMDNHGVTSSDRYWAERVGELESVENPNLRSEERGSEYWQESVHAVSDHDAYWTMVAV